MEKKSPIFVVVVCLANVCRSPMGEALLRHVAKERGLGEDDITVDSAGTMVVIEGSNPHPNSVLTCRNHGLELEHHARRLTKRDLSTFDHVLVVDNVNLKYTEKILPRLPRTAEAGSGAEHVQDSADESKLAVVRMWGTYDDGKEVPDPYGKSLEKYEACFQQMTRYAHAFLDVVFRET